jgi:tyrosyl-tRNA synthetase
MSDPVTATATDSDLEPALAREVDRQLELFADGAVEFYGRAELRERLAKSIDGGAPLRIKLGMDPSAADLHLGHTVVLHKLRTFQELGHTPIFLVGDFTAGIGDPSGRSKTRPPLDADQIRQNATTYVEQVAKIVDVDRGEVRFNSEWMNTLSPADFVRLCAKQTVARLLERDDFSKRYAEGTPIFAHELLYPFVQAYDSVVLEADVELGGTDQTFNMLMGREIQRDYGQLPQAVITHPLLVGTDGVEKMSKSLGNYIGIAESPEEIFGKVMSVSDVGLGDYVSVLSNREWDDLADDIAQVRSGGGEPMRLKKEVARRLVARFHGDEAAAGALHHFERVVQAREVPEDVPESQIALEGAKDLGVLELLEKLGWVESRGEARRLVAQGAVTIEGEKVSDPTLRLSAVPEPRLVRVGKRRFARFSLS